MRRWRPRPIVRSRARASPGRIEVADLRREYADRLAGLVDLPAIRASSLAVLADAMHGAAGSLLPDLLSGGSLRVEPFRTSRDPLFGGVHPEPIRENLEAAAALVRSGRLDLAVAQDGDADRLGVLDAEGRFVSPHQILALLLLHAFRARGLRGGIAKTFSTSFQIDRIARSLGAPLIETGIGFKYVAELMNRGEAAAGGEESGGYAFAFHLPERDGVLSALLLARKPRHVPAGPSVRRSTRSPRSSGDSSTGGATCGCRSTSSARYLDGVRNSRPPSIAGEAVTSVLDRDGIKYVFGERGWLLHRLSGTEPMVRLYCEHEDGKTMAAILDEAEDRLTRFVNGARALGPGL